MARSVLPNRDGAHLLPRTLPPLLGELNHEGDEVLVVDDASEDDSLAILRQEFSGVRVIGLEKNVGFGAACNLGFRNAGSALVLLLNSDMEVTPGAMELLLEPLADPEVFAVGPQFWSDDPALPRLPLDAPDRCQVGAPAGGGLFRREAYLDLGGFDALYHPFYWEDLDLGWNAWRRGWRVLFRPCCAFYHLESATIRRLYTPQYVRQVRMRNRCLFAWKNLRDPALQARFHARSLRRSLGALFRGRDASGIRGILASLPRIPSALHRRAAGGVRSDSQILAASDTSLEMLLKL